jgi:membrane protease YdiL (CAAX protease family)
LNWPSEALVLAPLPLAVLANLGRRHLSARVAIIVVFAAAEAVVGSSGLTLFSASSTGYRIAGLALTVGAAASAAALLPDARRLLARRLPFDPLDPVATTALATLPLLFASWVYNETAIDLLALESSGPRLTLSELALTELPMLAAAYLGVGLLVRRSMGAATLRLGLSRPELWQVGLALGLAIFFYVVGLAGDRLEHLVDPTTAARVDQATRHYYGALSAPWGLLAIAVLPAFCEETLFRGALQPRLGVVLAALGFAALHPQYGLTADAIVVLVLGLGLGLLRRFTQTTSAILAHAGYNAIAVIAPSPVWIGPAVAAEALLAAVLLIAWQRRRRRPDTP